jgi:hypothetical protein
MANIPVCKKCGSKDIFLKDEWRIYWDELCEAWATRCQCDFQGKAYCEKCEKMVEYVGPRAAEEDIDATTFGAPADPELDKETLQNLVRIAAAKEGAKLPPPDATNLSHPFFAAAKGAPMDKVIAAVGVIAETVFREIDDNDVLDGWLHYLRLKLQKGGNTPTQSHEGVTMARRRWRWPM